MMKQSRRTFIKNSTLTVSAIALSPSACVPTENGKLKTGIQLYTLRDDIKELGVRNVLDKLASIGYREVETFSYFDHSFFGLTPADFRKALDDAGITAVSGHYGTGKNNPAVQGSLTNGWDSAVEDALIVGQEYMAIGYLHEFERQSLDDYYWICDTLNEKGEECRKNGVQLCYHNHDFEFEELDGKIPYDIILERTGPDLVKMELDIYWTTKAGHDAIGLFEKHPGRFPLWHVKDMDDSPEMSFTEVGTGIIDYKSVFNVAATAGMTHFFAEQDQIKGDHFESVATSYKNIQSIIS